MFLERFRFILHVRTVFERENRERCHHFWGVLREGFHFMLHVRTVFEREKREVSSFLGCPSLGSCSAVYYAICDDCRSACVHRPIILRMPNPSVCKQSDCVGR